MKIALIENMNNNHFSLMRHLRDRGYDAHLFLSKNEGLTNLTHFLPDSDTFEIEKWEPYIHRTSFYAGGFRVLKNFLKRKEAKRRFKDFDFIIGCGFAPFIAWLGKKKLDIFLPHAVAGEWLGRTEIKNISLKQKIKNLVHHNIQYYCLKNNTRYIGSIDSSETNLVYYKKYKLMDKLRPLAIPMVYPEENSTVRSCGDKQVVDIIKTMGNRFPIVFCHSTHVHNKIAIEVKAIDKLITGFANYLKTGGSPKSILVFLEYGDAHGINASKSLIKELDIENNVFWIPKMHRKQIMLLLKYVHLGGGSFGPYTWSGVGWEFMSMGVPFMQNIGMTPEAFEKKHNMSCPNLFHTKNEAEITLTLHEITKHPELLKKRGKELKDWFDQNTSDTLDLICDLFPDN